jgi:putative serine protease PepD
LRVAAVVAAAVLLTGGAAYAVASTLSGSGAGNAPASVAGQHAWLGVDMAGTGSGGALVTRVIPGSPAAGAGIKPGDVITQIDTQPIAAPSIASAAIEGMQPGDQVSIELQRGKAAYSAEVTLAPRPAAYR